jgi:hypothetical protein
MRNLVTGILIGGCLASSVLVPLIFQQRRNWYEQGVVHGRFNGLHEAADAIEKEFGRYRGKGKYSLLFGDRMKTPGVVLLDEADTKTVRVISTGE